MNFSTRARKIIDLAARIAEDSRAGHISCEDLFQAAVNVPESCLKLAECLTGGAIGKLKVPCPVVQVTGSRATATRPVFSENCEKIIAFAQKLARDPVLQCPEKEGQIDLEHLICGLAASRHVCLLLEGVFPIMEEEAAGFISSWYQLARDTVPLAEQVEQLKRLERELLDKVYGQSQAIHTFIEGLHNTRITAAADRERSKPLAIFVYAGPPGVGKTYLSTIAARILQTPYKRFDMTAYSDHQDHHQLIGFGKTFQGAQPGQLTGFVHENPQSILLFDEIEKAHLNTIQLFYQILDSGYLEDRFLEEKVAFRDTTIIFTTNAGKSLYDNPNQTGMHMAGGQYPKRTILNALEQEKNPLTGKPVFPQAICSRLGQGYPLMFNKLEVNDLRRIADAELVRTENLFEQQYGKKISHSPMVPLALMLREGSHVDARQLRAESEKFIKGSLFQFMRRFDRKSLEKVMGKIERIRFEIDRRSLSEHREIETIFIPNTKPSVLLVSEPERQTMIRGQVSQVNWFSAKTADEVTDVLLTKDVDFVLLDLDLEPDRSAGQTDTPQVALSEENPLAGASSSEGSEILRHIHIRHPDVPVYLLSGTEKMDEELFLACVRSGGARGVLTLRLFSAPGDAVEEELAKFSHELLEVHERLYREKKIAELGNARKILKFDTTPQFRQHNNKLTLLLTGFTLGRSIDADDAGELISDIEKPNTRFEDVFGARAAKDALDFIVKWLKNPKYFMAMRIRPPKGILFAGPPGTGKTMLARALAGETQCAFLEKSASSFITKWQGSGPQAIHDLFSRARRYAPAIVFIDEIDSIGLVRQGGDVNKAEQNTLNALLTEMDGFGEQGNKQPIIVLAATNLADRLDPALKRRFDRTIEVDKPDRADREKYLEKALRSRSNSQVGRETIGRIARQSARMTIADLERVVHAAAVMAARQEQPVNDRILEEAFETTRMGEAKGTADPATLERVARHEAGHAVIACHGGNIPLQVTIVGRGNAGGYMEREDDESRLLYTRPELEQLICEAMGGRAAELIFYGETDGLSTGVAGDLQQATARALQMVANFGMDSEFGHFFLGESDVMNTPLAPVVTRQAEKIVTEQLERAKSILLERKSLFNAVIDTLLEKNRITRDELTGLLQAHE